jgi:thiol-disulfide isomerase/thioredoxin
MTNKMTVQIGHLAPPLEISEWVQGGPFNIGDLKGKVVVIEVFQVNCPGCFLYGIPEAVEIAKAYANRGVTVLGLATAFEDYELNTLENLKLLLRKREPVGETLRALRIQGRLDNQMKIPYEIPFPIAMDKLIKEETPIGDERMLKFATSNIPDFELYHQRDKFEILKRVKEYLESKIYSPATFEQYGLKGTPSTIYIDKNGNLRGINFGSQGSMKYEVEQLLHI